MAWKGPLEAENFIFLIVRAAVRAIISVISTKIFRGKFLRGPNTRMYNKLEDYNF